MFPSAVQFRVSIANQYPCSACFSDDLLLYLCWLGILVSVLSLSFHPVGCFATKSGYNSTDGVQLHIAPGPEIWRIPFGIQLVPGGIMTFGYVAPSF